jgi:chemotaxis protein CheZ
MHDLVEIERSIGELRQRYPDGKSDMVSDVVISILSTMSGDITAREAVLLSEIGALGRLVASTRAEIAALKVDDITASYIPCATDELDAIVSHTATATESILEVCETLDQLGGSVGSEDASILQNATMRIYEACSFQDITGQRITKVVTTLKTIEEKVDHIIRTFGRPDSEEAPDREEPAMTDADLLNGPQLPAHAMDQSDIDKLLASFE